MFVRWLCGEKALVFRFFAVLVLSGICWIKNRQEDRTLFFHCDTHNRFSDAINVVRPLRNRQQHHLNQICFVNNTNLMTYVCS